MTALFAPVVSITTTKRRRFFWALWTSGSPERAPFRKPDASGGGASTREEALDAATKASTHSRLIEIEPEWARAWIRVMRGQPAWLGAGSYPGARAERARDASAATPDSIWSVLGVPQTATPEELKAAFRSRALVTHPDQGGDAESFRRLVQAYREAQRRLRKPRRKPLP